MVTTKTIKFMLSLLLEKDRLRTIVNETADVDRTNLINKGDSPLQAPSSVYSCFQKIIERARPFRDEQLVLIVRVNTINFSIPFFFRNRVVDTWTEIRCKFLQNLIDGV